MEKKYLINLECSINALAELIALGLEKHCTITKLEMFDQPAEEKKPALQVAFLHGVGIDGNAFRYWAIANRSSGLNLARLSTTLAIDPPTTSKSGVKPLSR